MGAWPTRPRAECQAPAALAHAPSDHFHRHRTHSTPPSVVAIHCSPRSPLRCCQPLPTTPTIHLSLCHHHGSLCVLVSTVSVSAAAPAAGAAAGAPGDVAAAAAVLLNRPPGLLRCRGHQPDGEEWQLQLLCLQGHLDRLCETPCSWFQWVPTSSSDAFVFAFISPGPLGTPAPYQSAQTALGGAGIFSFPIAPFLVTAGAFYSVALDVLAVSPPTAHSTHRTQPHSLAPSPTPFPTHSLTAIDWSDPLLCSPLLPPPLCRARWSWTLAREERLCAPPPRRLAPRLRSATPAFAASGVSRCTSRGWRVGCTTCCPTRRCRSTPPS